MRKKLLEQSKKAPQSQGLRCIDFLALTMAEKKLVAAQFIDRILLSEDAAEII